jgi:two-component sensor histidine kinase
MRGIGSAGWHRHRVANWLQTVVLILALQIGRAHV